MNLYELRAQKIARMNELSAADVMSEEEIREFDLLETEVGELTKKIGEMEQRQARAAELRSQMTQRTSVPERGTPGVATVLRGERGDNEANAWKAYFAHGDSGGLRHLQGDDGNGKPAIVLQLPSQERRAVVDSNMNITTPADGGSTVPTGLAGQIATRKNERMLAPRIGCRQIPGIGTTVNYPYESADPEVFAVTTEQVDAKSTNYQRNAVPTGAKAFTLAKKTRKVELTEELLSDSAINVQSYVADRIGREIAKTHNADLVAEVAANGTSFKTFASTTVIAAGELEPIVGEDSLGFYLEDAATVSWIMRSSVHWAIRAITANNRLYAQNEAGLLGYPVAYSNAVASPATTAKTVLFGCWDYMGYRESPDIRFISDPYSVDGLVILKYSFRDAYGILQSAAIGYGKQA